MEQIRDLGTEETKDDIFIDECSAIDIVTRINEEDAKVAEAIALIRPVIAQTAEAMAKRFNQGGRIIYVGAGSSGRIGVMDAVELQPTYNVPNDRAFGVLAGGKEAMLRAVEGAEDSEALGIQDMSNLNLTKNDTVIGIAASGRTPYTIAAINYAKEQGALTVAVTNNANSKLGASADFDIAAKVGPEVVAGSTRMKAGTAQKMIVNMLSTTTMILCGRVYRNTMAHVLVTNEKLEKRAHGVLMKTLEISESEAIELYEQAHHNVAVGIIMNKKNLNYETSLERLNRVNGNIHQALDAEL